jgi:hypothetical protein
MRRRFLLALVAGGLAIAGGVALADQAAPSPDPGGSATSLDRAQLSDVPAPTALSRVRDGLGHGHDARRDLVAALGAALLLTLAGGWWLTRERAARVHLRRSLATPRTRAPPWMPTTVHC